MVAARPKWGPQKPRMSNPAPEHSTYSSGPPPLTRPYRFAPRCQAVKIIQRSGPHGACDRVDAASVQQMINWHKEVVMPCEGDHWSDPRALE